MKSLILQTATRYLFPLLVLFSVFLLFRGHDHPGGGFIGGLMAAAAVVLCALAIEIPVAQKILPFPSRYLLGLGLLIAAGSGLAGLLSGMPFLTSAWGSLDLPGLDPLPLGTPLLFDVGVYLTVIGAIQTVLLAFAEEGGVP